MGALTGARGRGRGRCLLSFTLYVDADGCPAQVRDVALRAARRTGVPIVLVANRDLAVKGPNVRAVRVARGMDVADDWIVAHAVPGDLVITQDVPLAAEVVARGVAALSPHGEAFTASNIRERLSIRDFFTEVRASGVITGGPRPFDAAAGRAFANALDRWLTAALRRPPGS